MLEVDVAVVGPEAAVVEAEDVVEPVGEARDAGGLLVGRGSPVVASVRGAAPHGVPCEHLGARSVVAALLPRGVSGAVGGQEMVGNCPENTRRHLGGDKDTPLRCSHPQRALD